MNILVINAGSSSCKYQLRDMESQRVLCSGIVERIGEPMGKLTHKIAPDTDKAAKIVVEQPFPTHTDGMKKVVELLTDPEKGVIKDKADIAAIGHRVLHGGEEITAPVLVDEHIKTVIRDCIPLGPLHNPANLAGIEVAEKLFPGTPNVAVFDTEFGMSMPPSAYIYPLPYELYTELKIRRYGFHGTSHKYVAGKTAEFLGKPLSELNAVIMHLGNGSSMSAVRNGKCADTSMGLTPLEGLMMGTRCGSIDPAIEPFIMKKLGLSPADMDTLMNKKSGLKGISGFTDMRDLHAACEKGDEKAQLALAMLIHRIKKLLGAYYALLGHVDAVVFTAGIGENDDIVRARVCKNMEVFGIAVDPERNAVRNGEPRIISPDGCKVPVLVIPTNEELAIAVTTMELVRQNRA